MIKVKKGVKTKGLKRPMVKVLDFANDLYSLCGVDLVITDAVAKRGKDSLHPLGFAIDIRTRNLNHNQTSIIFTLLIKHLGNDYDVIRYETHIHIEYQRHIDDNKQADFEKTFLVNQFSEVD